MAAKAQVLRIPRELIESTDISERRRAVWKILVSDERLFRKNGESYELLTNHLVPLVNSECGVEAGGRDFSELLASYSESPSLAKIAVGNYFGEDGVAIELPHELYSGKTLRGAVLQIAVAHASQSGEDLKDLTQSLLSRIKGQRERQVWQIKKLAKAEGIPLSMMTISTETGMLTVGPARDLDHRSTQVLDRENARMPIAFFVGGSADKPFKTIFCDALSSWLKDDGSPEEEGEKQGLQSIEAIQSLVLNAGYKRSKGLEFGLGDFLKTAGEDEQKKFFDILSQHGRKHTLCPIQFNTGNGGDLHLGQLPVGFLRHLLQAGRRHQETIIGEDGRAKKSPAGLLLSEEEEEKILSQYSEAWGVKQRANRLSLAKESMDELRRGSIGFLEIIKGGTTIGSETAQSGWIAEGMEDSVGRLLKTIEAHYREGMPKDERIPPAGLLELCDKFLEDDRSPSGKPTKRAERFESELEAYKTQSKPGFTARNSFYQTVAEYMVDRFGSDTDKGPKRDMLTKELGTLVGAGDRTQFLYIITDPANRTTKVGIANNLETRLRDLEKENGVMVPVACYAIKSIPVAQWGTGLMDFLTENCGNCGLPGNSENDGVRKIAQERWSELLYSFKFAGADGRAVAETPEHMLEFFCTGVSNMLKESGHALADFSVRGDKNAEQIEEARRKITKFLRTMLQNPSETREGCRYPDQFIDSVANLWVRTKGSISFGDAATQRECITNINNALSSLFQAQSDSGGKAKERVRTLLNAAAELIPAPVDDAQINPGLLEKISKHGEHLGAKAFEWDIHQFLQSLRMGKSEMFYAGTNYPKFLDIIEERMGSGVAGRRFALGRDDERGQRARALKDSVSCTVKPAVCLSSNAENLELYKRIKDHADQWLKNQRGEVALGSRDKAEIRENLRAVAISELKQVVGGKEALSQEALEGIFGGLHKKGDCSGPCPLGDAKKRAQWISDLGHCGTSDETQFLTNKGKHSVSRGELLMAARIVDAAVVEDTDLGKILRALADARNENSQSSQKTGGLSGVKGGKAKGKVSGRDFAQSRR
jgi:hypothetical protein